MKKKKTIWKWIAAVLIILLIIGGIGGFMLFRNMQNMMGGSVELDYMHEQHEEESGNSVVYMTSEITPEALLDIYAAPGEELEGEQIAVKLSAGEPPASNYLDPDLIKDLVQSVNGTIVECNTAYGGSRSETAMHYQVAEDHGFTEIADVVIMDEDGSTAIPVALDQACVDLVYQAEGDTSFVERMEGRNAERVLEHGEKIGLGSRSYRLLSIQESQAD